MSFPVSSVEYSAIKTDLINYFKANDEFKDYNFDGSGLNLILSILSYVTHYNIHYLSMSTSDAFLSTAQIFKNVVLRARDLNYIPRRKTGAEAVISMAVKTAYIPSDPDTVITMPKYTNFSVGGYNFYTTQEYLFNYANDYSFSEIVIRQGTYQTVSFTSSGLVNQYFDVENTTIDNDTLEVYVDGVLWSNQNNITSLDENSETYQIELTEDNYVRIIFGDNILGKVPDNGADIQVIYTITNGLDGNGFTTFTLSDIVQDQFSTTYDNSKFDMATVEISAGGAEYETMESIKNNAPKFYESQGRLVTKNDYISLLSQHQLVDAVNVYGGSDDLINPYYGKVYIAVKPVSALNLTTLQKTTLMEYIDSRNILTIHPEFVDVRYIYVDIGGTVYYKQQYESSLPETRNTVENTITDFFNDMVKFDSMFKQAKLITSLNNLDRVGNTNLTFYPHVFFEKDANDAYIFKLLNNIVPESIDCDIVDGFYDDGMGNILTKKTGNAIIGEVDYSIGLIEIYPGYEISDTEPADGYRLDFQTVYGDISYQNQNSVALNEISLAYSRFV